MKIIVETKDYGTVITKDVYNDMEHFRNNVWEHNEPFITVDEEMYFYTQIKQARPYKNETKEEL
jgi:hypothetical protein